jgi:proteasome lid subunit RPN8/RPN11
MILIPRNILEDIVRQARAELPHEACGLLAGVDSRVQKRFPLENVDHSPEHFSFDPREQFRVLREARAGGMKILANYHSHPSSPARPSEEDIRLAFDHAIHYLIVSLAGTDPDLKAFIRTPDGMIPTEIQIIQGCEINRI